MRALRTSVIGVTTCFSILFILFSCGKDSPNEAPPSISINNVSSAEGNSGTTAFNFEVSLSTSVSKVVTLHYRTSEVTAKNDEDFVPVSDATLSFQPGETKKTITIQVVADDLKEANETFLVRLSNASFGNLIVESGTGTITNDDTKINIPTTGYVAPGSYAGYTLAWEEQFNGPTLDAANWAYDLGDGCPNLCGWGNNELEYYTNSPENLFFQDGNMIIQAKQEAYGGRNYTSAKIKTDGKKSFRYGRIDIRAVLPEGKGIWPAFWLLPQSNQYGTWPKSGEIDLMEFLGHETNKVYGTAHYGPGPGSVNISRNYQLNAGSFHDQFHVFSIEWKQDEIKWLVDNNVYSTVKKTDLGTFNYPFNEYFYLIVNLAVGGNWPGAPDATTGFPQYLVVDYIKVYQQ